MASDPLREAIERALPCTCADQSQTCPRGFSADVHKAVAPLLAAERASKRAEANAILDANSMEECARLRAALADELERREALVVVADARLAYILEWADVIEHYAHAVPEEVLDRARRPYRDAALAASEAKEKADGD